MKVLLVHNTKNLTNIGCKMTSTGLELLLKNHEVRSIDAHAIFDVGREISFNRFKFLNRLKLSYILRSKDLMKELDWCEILVINGEGSVHHRRITGSVLLAIAVEAKERGKKVHICNATFDSLSSDELKILRKLDRIVVREDISYKYLEKNGVNAVLGADAAWLYLDSVIGSPLEGKETRESNQRVLITGGVVPHYEKIVRIAKDAGLTGAVFDYLYVDTADDCQLDFLKTEIKFEEILDANALLNDKFGLLQNYSLVISGRHHIAIVSLYCKVPVIVIPSNTYKIEGTLNSVKSRRVSEGEMRAGITASTNEIINMVRLAHNNISF